MRIKFLPAQDTIQAIFCDGRQPLEQFQVTLFCGNNHQDSTIKPVDEYNNIIRVIQGHQLSDGDLETLKRELDIFKKNIRKARKELQKVSTYNLLTLHSEIVALNLDMRYFRRFKPVQETLIVNVL